MAPVVLTNNLKRFFKIHQREAGLKGAVKSFFSRRYQTVKAVDDISFSLEKGELVGFIGPNGAGKTTTLKCLSGLLHPDGGSVLVLGFQPWQRRPDFLRQISLVMGQKNQLWWDLPARETFLLNKEIYEIPDAQFQKNLDQLARLLEIEEILDVQVRKLSLGQRMKCELIAALLHSPQVLFLDEPTIGLDVVMQKKMRDFIKEYNRRFKTTVLLTSHYMGDVLELCRRVLIIDKGQLVFDGQLSEIAKKYAGEKRIKVTLAKEVDPKKIEALGKVKNYHYPQLTLTSNQRQIPTVVAKVLEKLPVADLNVEETAIEDVVRKLFTDKNYA